MQTSTTPDVIHPYIERRADVQGGSPVIRGTRFPVHSIVQNYRRGLSVEEILRDFPTLTPAQVHDALSYYYDHTAEIEQELARTSDLDQAMRQFPASVQPMTS